MNKIVALVPMRHHSQRVPGKNYRPLGGKPLFHHIISTLLGVPEIAEILVDTDSPEVIAGLKNNFPVVRVIERPDHLRSDDTAMNEILAYDTAQVQADFYLQTHSTNPLLKAETISTAFPPRSTLLSPIIRLTIHSFQSHAFKPACGTSWGERSTIIRQFFCKLRICPRFTRKIPASIFLSGKL